MSIPRRFFLLAAAASWPMRGFAGTNHDYDIGGDDNASFTFPIAMVDGHCLIPVCINGQCAPFILDTGATISVIDQHFATLAHIDGPVATALTMAIGHATFAPMPAMVMPFPTSLMRAESPRIGGIIGLNLFADCALRLDLKRQIGTILPAATQPAPGAQILPLTLPVKAYPQFGNAQFVRHAALPALIDGIALTLIVDTGAATDIFLNNRCVTRHNLLTRYPNRVTRHEPGGIDGPMVLAETTAQNLTLGTTSIAAPRLSLEPAPTARFAHADGLIGLPALARFTLLLDLQSQVLALE